MEMELHLILNRTNFNDIFFEKMTECKGFQNSKNSSQDQIRHSIIKKDPRPPTQKNKKQKKSKLKVLLKSKTEQHYKKLKIKIIFKSTQFTL